MHGVVIERTTQVSAQPARGIIVGAAIGTSTAGAKTATNGLPALVNTLAEAREVFGSAGTLIDAATTWYALTSNPFVGVLYDHVLTGGPLQMAQTAALNALAQVPTTLGVRPRLIASNGTTFANRSDTTQNTNATTLKTIALRLGAKVLADSANDTRANAVAWATVNGGNDLMATPQLITTPDGSRMGSVYFMAAIADNITRRGLVESISNKPLIHISAATPVYSHDVGLANDDADALSAAGALIAVRDEGTWVGWGGRTRYTPAGSVQRFYNVDMVVNNAERGAQRVANRNVDRTDNATFLSRVVSRIDDYLTGLVSTGQLLAFTVGGDPVRNTPVALNAGRAVINMTLQPARNVELITINIQVS